MKTQQILPEISEQQIKPENTLDLISEPVVPESLMNTIDDIYSMIPSQKSPPSTELPK
jgi:hypothetical protein